MRSAIVDWNTAYLDRVVRRARQGRDAAGLRARFERGTARTPTKALKAAGCRRVFEGAASGDRWDRPEVHRMLDHLRGGDTVVVWKLARLSRSLKDVLHIMGRIAKAGAGFRDAMCAAAIDLQTDA